MPQIHKWRRKFFVIKSQIVSESIITHIFYFKIFVIVQNGLLSLIKIVKLYFFHFF